MNPRCLFHLVFYIIAFDAVADAVAPDLVIQVIRGAGTNNNAVSGELASPVVRVTNAAGAAVAGALVVFTAPSSGPSVEFTGSGPNAQALSDESGIVAAPRVHPTGADGQVEIRVMAAKDGKTANTSIFQMNLGLESSPDSPDSLEIAMLPMVENPVFKSTGRRRFRFRVETMSGKPLAGAWVQMTAEVLKDAEKPGKSKVINQIQEISAADGTVLIIVERDVGRVPVEITVKALLGGRSATRYFVIKT